jgi:hypothetical protein
MSTAIETDPRTMPQSIRLIEHFCLRDDLSTYDPYDIWKTRLGFAVKDFYNGHRVAGLPLAAGLALFDNCLNNRRRLFYSRLEYPIVRALAALTLIRLYRRQENPRQLEYARRHLEWLAAHPCEGYRGTGWGLPFAHAVSKTVRYAPHTPFCTITPYCLEAFAKYAELTGDDRFRRVIERVHLFFEQDIVVMEEGDDYTITSYGPLRDRIVVNAVSYVMYSYALLLPYLSRPDQARARERIGRLYHFVKATQEENGSWRYAPKDESSFIDCFHSCIVLKNLIKTNRHLPLQEVDSVVQRGYAYLKREFLDSRWRLFRRFSVRNKPGIVKFDLYDNAEMLNLGVLLADERLVQTLSTSIKTHFCDGRDIYSQIDVFHRRRNVNMLRWAVMSYLYAASQVA